MNLNKLTKKEIISKIKNLEGTQNNSIGQKGFLSYNMALFWDFFKLSIKKFGFMAILFRVFKKYSLFRRVYLLINGCVMAIFGISILEFYGLSFISALFAELDNILGNIIWYIQNTYFYSVLAGIFTTKVEIEPTSIKMRTTDKNTETDKKSHKISDWIYREEIVEEETSNTKYYVIAGIIVLSCLTWYYWDNITPGALTLWESLKKGKPKQRGDDGTVVIADNPKNIPTDNNLNISDKLIKLKDTIKSKFYKNEPTPPKINTEAVTQPSMISTSSEVKLEAIDVDQSSATSIASMDHYFPELKTLKEVPTQNDLNARKLEVLTNSDTKFKPNLVDFKLKQDLTGQTDLQQFINNSAETNSLLERFFEYNNTASFPKHAVKVAVYQTIATKIKNLQLKSNGLYYEWLKKDSIKERIENFFKLEKEILDVQAYDELSKATSQEQDVWSDRVGTPSIHSELSQTNNQDKELDSPLFNSYAVEDQEVLDYKKELDKFISVSNTENVQQPSSSLDGTYTGPILEEMPLLKEFLPKKDDSNLEVEPLVYATENNTGIRGLLEQINQRRDDSNVVSTPKVNRDHSNIDIVQNEIPPQDIVDTSVTTNQDENLEDLLASAIRTIKEDVGLKNDLIRNELKDEIKPEHPQIEIDSDTNSSMEHYFPKQELTQSEVKTGFNALFDSINKRRDDSNVVGTPSVTKLGLGLQDSPKVLSPLEHKPSFSNLFEDTMDLFDEEDEIQHNPHEDNSQPINTTQEQTTYDIINSWDKIRVENTDDKTKIIFDDLWRNVESVHFSTNNGHLKSFDLEHSAINPNPDNNIFHVFRWKEGIRDSDFLTPTVLKEIIIKDTQGNNHTIYKVNN